MPYIPRALYLGPDDGEPSYRSAMLPFATYPNADGSGDHFGFAVPGAIEEPLNALSRLFGTPSNPGTFPQGPDVGIASDNPNRSVFPNKQDMTSFLLSTYAGNAMNPGRLMEGAAAKAAIPEAMPPALSHVEDPALLRNSGLSMDQAARLARAQEQGFDTSVPMYHGSDANFDAFDVGHSGSQNIPIGTNGIFFTPSEGLARTYQDMAEKKAQRNAQDVIDEKNAQRWFWQNKLPDASRPEGTVHSVFVRPGRQAVFDQSLEENANNLRRNVAQARSDGYDSVILRNHPDAPDFGNPDELVVFDPSNIRSVNAAFDPANIGRNGLFFSDTGKPSIPGAALAGAEAPQRMYHGTGVPEEFSTFQPSQDGAFGPGVYFSTEPDVAGQWAGMGPQPRVIPADVAGPFASDTDYWKAFADNGKDRSATMQALLDQGYNGVSLDTPGRQGNINVTNVFRPGTVKSPLTGETLFSDTGKPSIPGSIVAGSERLPDDYWDYARRATNTIPGRGPLSVNRPYVMHGNAPIDEADRMFAQMDKHIPVDMPNNELPAFDTLYDRAAAQQAWRDKIRRTGELYSDGKPSLMGSALSSLYDQQPRNSLLDY